MKTTILILLCLFALTSCNVSTMSKFDETTKVPTAITKQADAAISKTDSSCNPEGLYVVLRDSENAYLYMISQTDNKQYEALPDSIMPLNSNSLAVGIVVGLVIGLVLILLIALLSELSDV